MKNHLWVSPYQDKDYIKSQTKEEDIDEDERKTAVAIMLDLQDTLDGIDDEKAQIFMEQLNRLRLKYNADKIIINLSSHMNTPNGLISYLEILHRNLKPNIILDDAAYLSGTYNYETGVDDFKGFGYNLRKTSVFEEKYFREYNVVCHGIIDDSVSSDYIKDFKDKKPVFIIRPSLLNEEELSKDNMMCHSTLTEGFLGVLECMDSYLSVIENIPSSDIVKMQSEELIHLSALEVKNSCINKNFDLVLRYVIEGKLDDDDYERVARELVWSLKADSLTTDDLNKIRGIIEALNNYLDKNNEYLLSLINLCKGVN